MDSNHRPFVISIPYEKSVCINQLDNQNDGQSVTTLYDVLESRFSYLTNLDYYIADIGGHALPRNACINSVDNSNDKHQNQATLPLLFNLIYRCRGGKGGFGSQLRAQGGRMASQKSTNFEACRDLSGRRLKTVNDAKKLAEYMAREPERQREKQERIQKKIQEGLKAGERMLNNGSASKRPALSQEYVEELEKVGADVKSAVAKAMAKSNGVLKTQPVKKPNGGNGVGSGSGSSSISASSDAKSGNKPVAKKIWGMDEDESDDESGDEGDSSPNSEKEKPADAKGKGRAVGNSSAKRNNQEDADEEHISKKAKK